MELKDRLPEFVGEEIDALVEKGAELFEIKSNLEDIMAEEAEITETTEAEVDSNGPTVGSVINDAITALNTLSEQLSELEAKAGDAPGFSNTAPDSSERAEGAAADAPEVVEDLSHGGPLTPDQMAVAGSPAGGDAKPAKAPKAADPEPAAEEDEKSEEVVEEVATEDAEEAKTEPTNDILGGLDLTVLREFQDLITYSELGE